MEKKSQASSASRYSYSKNAVSAKKIKGIMDEMEKMKEAMVSRCHHRKPESMTRQVGTTRTSGFSFLNPSETMYQPRIIEDLQTHQLNGYTKNISGLVFSPGLYTRPKTASQYNSRKSVAIPQTPAVNKEPSSPVNRSADLKSTLSGKKSVSRYSKTE